jgi:MFS family permease
MDEVASSQPSADRVRLRYRSYLLTILIVILALNSSDRVALGLLLQDIKVDLALSDTQLGFLTGLAFAFFYSTMGVPIARWADRGNRVNLISVTMALWCAALSLCGLAGTFLQLLLIRIGVAVGEAGCIPPAHSLIADYYDRAERPRAVSRYMLGASIGTIIGFFSVGWLNELLGWRMTFVALGVPGLIVALLAWLTLKEPRRSRHAARGTAAASDNATVMTHAAAAAPANLPATAEAVTPAQSAARSMRPSAKVVAITLWANRTFRHLVFFNAIVSFFGFGILQWQATFFVRTHGLQTGELGTWLALIAGVGSLLGTYWGGELASRYAASNERLQLKAMAAAYSTLGIFSALVYLAPNASLAFVCLSVATVGGAIAVGPLYATMQTLVPDRMRAVSVALMYLIGNLLGMGLGPLLAGVLSDAFRPWAGEESLRYALLVLCPGYFWGAWHLWSASRTVTRDLKAVQGPP